MISTTEAMATDLTSRSSLMEAKDNDGPASCGSEYNSKQIDDQ